MGESPCDRISSHASYVFAVTQHTDDADVFVAFRVVALHVHVQQVAGQEASVHDDWRAVAIAIKAAE